MKTDDKARGANFKDNPVKDLKFKTFAGGQKSKAEKEDELDEDLSFLED